MFKALVAAACVAVLAYVGYFFWGQVQTARAVADAQQAQSVRVDCLKAVVQFITKATDQTLAPMNKCLAAGVITQDDITEVQKNLGKTSFN